MHDRMCSEVCMIECNQQLYVLSALNSLYDYVQQSVCLCSAVFMIVFSGLYDLICSAACMIERVQ
jgi:hypothetical protein